MEHSYEGGMLRLLAAPACSGRSGLNPLRVDRRHLGGDPEGPDAMRGQYGPLFRDSPQLSVEIPSRMVAGGLCGR